MILLTDCPNWVIADGGAQAVVVSLIEGYVLPSAVKEKDRSSMHLYGLLLCGIIATGEIFKLRGMLSFKSPT